MALTVTFCSRVPIAFVTKKYRDPTPNRQQITLLSNTFFLTEQLADEISSTNSGLHAYDSRPPLVICCINLKPLKLRWNIDQQITIVIHTMRNLKPHRSTSSRTFSDLGQVASLRMWCDHVFYLSPIAELCWGKDASCPYTLNWPYSCSRIHWSEV